MPEVTSRQMTRGDLLPPGWGDRLAAAALAPGGARWLVVHATEAGRASVLEALLERVQPAPVPAGDHVTLDGLSRRLAAALDLPPRVQRSPALSVLVHEELVAALDADPACLAPLISPGMQWSMRRTSALQRRLEAVATVPWRAAEDPLGGPLTVLIRALETVARRQGGLHPALWWREVARACAVRDQPPPALADLAGVVVLDLPPDTPPLAVQTLAGLARWWPVEAWSAPGQQRDGTAGLLLVDRTPDSAPDDGRAEPTTHHLLFERREDELGLAADLISAWLRADAARQPADVLLLDAAAAARVGGWQHELAGHGLGVHRTGRRPGARGPVAWVRGLLGLVNGADAWSAGELLLLAEQREFAWLELIAPASAAITPHLDGELLAEVARARHLLPGPDALERWLEALADPTVLGDDVPRRRLEQQEAGQRALLLLAGWLAPLADDGHAALDATTWRGVATGASLTLTRSDADADDWLHDLRHLAGFRRRLRRVGPGTPSDAAGLQALLVVHSEWLEGSLQANRPRPRRGRAWCETVLELIDGLDEPLPGHDPAGVRLLTPEEALGCRGELVVLCGLAADQWRTRAASVPLLDDETRRHLQLLDPDLALRTARHAWEHALVAAPAVVVLDPTPVPGAEAAAPLALWRRTRRHGTAEPPDWWYDTSEHGPLRRLEVEGETRLVASLAWAEVDRDLGQVRARLRVAADHGRRLRLADGMDLQADVAPRRAPRAGATAVAARTRVLAAARADQPPLAEGEPWARTEDPPRLTVQPRDLVPAALERARLVVLDPRPLAPLQTDVAELDARLGRAGPLDLPGTWSASRLDTWLACPRRGWLEHRLRAATAEPLSEDLDARTLGALLHTTWQDVLAEALDLRPGEARGDDGGADHLGAVPRPRHEHWRRVRARLVARAPWLLDEDGPARQTRRRLTGLSEADELRSPDPLPPAGTLGGLLDAELGLADLRLLAVEWRFGLDAPCSIPLTDSADGPSLAVRGAIDRVETIGHGPPLDGVTPLHPRGSTPPGTPSTDTGPTPPSGRWVILRDLKRVHGPTPQDHARRHARSVLTSTQLALYARAWEVSHPGDTVVGVGVTEVGERTRHWLELDPRISPQGRWGRATAWTTRLHPEARLPFRAWMARRLAQIQRLMEQVEDGFVAPNPGDACDFCPVRGPCGMAAPDLEVVA